MKTLKIKFLILLFLLGSLTSACVGRTPSPKTAQNLTQHYFAKYAKKYKTSLYGQTPVQKVLINQIVENSRYQVAVDATLTLKGGTQTRVLLNTHKNAPLPWKVVSWEQVDSSLNH